MTLVTCVLNGEYVMVLCTYCVETYLGVYPFDCTMEKKGNNLIGCCKIMLTGTWVHKRGHTVCNCIFCRIYVFSFFISWITFPTALSFCEIKKNK